MNSDNGLERAGEEPAVGSTDGNIDRATDGSADGPTEGENTAVEPTPPASPDQPGERRRKAGVQYRPV